MDKVLPHRCDYCYGPMKYEPFALSWSKGFDPFDGLRTGGSARTELKTSSGRIYSEEDLLGG
ncbi:MAG: hypothetical protein CVU24_06070 [Betaproteobacteria bacterium HGW-Betaproteobacteria-18]|nr:MAG: hypothetical protein CVU24_06070 [Betaproteobacteria bacterium HGW-Betaproteobacteria-18]